MEGFELINKYNARCLQWRHECATLLAAWANAGNDKDDAFVKEVRTIAGFLRVASDSVRYLLEAVGTERIEYVVLALRYLRNKATPPKPACQFCTRLAEKGEHVPACLGETPTCGSQQPEFKCHLPADHLGFHKARCDRVAKFAEGLHVQCQLDKGHAGDHGYACGH